MAALVTAGAVGCAAGGVGGVPVAPAGTTVVDRSLARTPAADADAGGGAASATTGNSGPPDGDGAADAVRGAAGRTAAMAQLGYALTVSAPGGGPVPVLAVNGAVDRAAGRHSMVVRQWLAGDTAPPETSDVIVDGDAVYLRSPVVARLAAPGAAPRTWLRLAAGPAMVPGVAAGVDGPAAVTGLLALVATAQSAAPAVADTVGGAAASRHRVVLAGAGTTPASVGVWQVVDGAALAWVDDTGLLRAAEVVVAGEAGVRLVVRFEVTATDVSPAPVPTGDAVVDVAPAAVPGVVR